jgi:outer membrane receptor protein involved in Fe transport
VKADASLRAYGQAGAEGVVVVATKLRQAMVAGELREKRPLGTEVAETEVLETRQRAREVELRSAAGEGTVRFRAAASPAETPLIIVDGVIVSPSFNLNQLDPESIDQIEIVKGEAARRLYSNPRALNGVITITTKKR